MKKLNDQIKSFFKGKIISNESLATHTSMKVGGIAEFFLQPQDYDDLALLIKFFNAQKIRYMIIGAGNNLLIEDNYLPIAVIKLDSPIFTKISCVDNRVYAAAGTMLGYFIQYLIDNELSGGEFLTGIPGTIGGALIMNAGTRDIAGESNLQYKSIADILEKVKLMNPRGEIVEIQREGLDFEYRNSNFKDYIILGAWFCLQPKSREIIENTLRKFSEHKQKTQVVALPNAGCIFKNPVKSRMSAGEMIDQCCLKGVAIGDAQISTEHANFIVNCGNAKFEQITQLMDKIRHDVNARFDVMLEPEVKILKNNH